MNTSTSKIKRRVNDRKSVEGLESLMIRDPRRSNSYHKIVGLNAEQITEVTERNGRVNLEAELTVVMRGRHA